MEIHKPKPIHNLRDFLKEVGTIVLGVCIALAAEQTVEYFHWRSEVSVARKALRDEITSINRFYVRTIAVAPCAAKQEQEARVILDSLEGKGEAVPFTAFHHGVGGLLSESEWQSERSAQVLTHFPRAELAQMSRYYAMLPAIALWLDEAGSDWSELSILQNPPARLEPSDIARLRGKLDRAHRLNYLMLLNAYRMLKLSDQLGIVRPQLDPGYVDRLCKASTDETEAIFLKAETQP